MHGIYKYVLDDKILYIGKTDNSFQSRIKGHAKEDRFQPYLNAEVFVFTTANRTEATIYEKLLINKYQPVLNVIDTHETADGIDFNEPEWMSYEEFKHTLEYSNKKKKLHRQIEKNISKKIMEYSRLLSKYELDLRLWNRELWLVSIFDGILNSNSFEKEIEIPTEYYFDDLPDSNQFQTITSMLNSFNWISYQDLRAFDICSRNQQHSVLFFANHLSSHKYKFYIHTNKILCELYMRILANYKHYVKTKKVEVTIQCIKGTKDKLCELHAPVL